MQLTPLPAVPESLPLSIARFLSGTPVFDSSCSAAARVYFIDRDAGFFLKSASAGTLREEALMTRFFHSLGLGPEVVAFESAQRDFLLTARVPGEDCVQKGCLQDPIRLCDTFAVILRQLHDTPAPDCPVTRPAPDLSDLEVSQNLPHFDDSLYLDNCPFPSPEAAWDTLQALAPELQPEVLTHGDFCLPNVILRNWNFSGLIDLGSSGLGNRHHDLFWGLWSLCYNLKTDRYTARFLDAYGRDRIDRNLLRAVAALEGFGIA